MSSSPFSSASGQRSSGTVRVISLRSQSVVRLRQRLDRLLEMPPVRVHRPEHHVVLEHELVVERAHVHAEGARRRDAREADDGAGRRVLHGAGHQLGHAGALHHDVRLDLLGNLGHVTGVVAAAESVHRLRLCALGGAVEDVDLEPALRAHQRAEQADRAGAGHERPLVRRARARADAVDLLPRLGEHAGRLGEDPERPEFVGDRNREVRLERHELGAVAVERLDAALGVLPVAAHVPLALGAAGARHRVGAAHDAGHELPGVLSRARAAHARAPAAPDRAGAPRGRPRRSRGQCRRRRGRAARRAAHRPSARAPGARSARRCRAGRG